MGAVVAADGGTIHRYVWQEELNANRWTPARLSQVCKIAVQPILTKYKKAAPQSQDNGRSGAAGLMLRNARGRPAELAVSMFQSDRGPRANFGYTVLGAWAIDYRLEHDKPFSEQTYCAGVVAGWEKYGSQLEQLGFRVLVNETSDGELESESVTSLVEACRTRLEQLAKAEIGE
ncbi:MAG: hypothetical protein AB7F50_02275 [Fimbriimonadaceae bacterium]